MATCIKCKKEIPNESMFCLHCGKKQVVGEKKKAKKRANGTGSVYKLKGNRKKPFYAIKREYVNNILISTPLGCYATETEARLVLDAANNQNLPPEYNSTLEEIYNTWSRTHFKDLSKSSIEGYVSAWKHLAPCHNKKMRNIKTYDFQCIIDSLVAKGKSYSTCDKIRILANKLCTHAMENDIVLKNYAIFIKMPKNEKTEKEIFSKRERDILFEHKDNIVAQIILVFIYTGTRIEELFSIVTKNVFIEKGYMIGGEKTEAGRNRIIPINQKILPFIKRWYNPDNEYLLVNSTGGKKNARNFREREFYPFLKEIGILSKDEEKPRLTPHSARHTFSSLMVKAGAKPELLQKIIGHANYETTIDTYTHFTEEDIGELVLQVNKI